MKRLTSIGRRIWWWRFVWIRLEKVFERHRPIQCNWHIRLVNWVAFMLQSIVRLGHAMATNSHCTQRCFHFISYVVCLVVFFIYSFSLVFRFIRFYFIFFCAFSFRHLWFIPLSIVFDQLECVERGGGKHNTKCDLQLEQTLAKIWFCLAMYVDFVCYVAKWQRDGDWFDHIYIGACIFKSQSNDMNYVSLLLSMFPFLWHGTMHTFIEHFF